MVETDGADVVGGWWLLRGECADEAGGVGGGEGFPGGAGVVVVDGESGGWRGDGM